MEDLAPLPNGRSHLGVVALNGKIYAIGGQFGNDEGLTTQKYLDVWDPANPSVWTRLADMPTAISHIASATFVFGDRIITMGGETAHNVATNLVYAYDPATDKWAAMTKLPAARFSGVGDGDRRVYLFHHRFEHDHDMEGHGFVVSIVARVFNPCFF